MSRPLGRRPLIQQGALALAGLLVLPARGRAAASGPASPYETSFWKFTGETRCQDGRVYEYWCYYECVGQSCTIIQCEWRPTDQACGR